MKKLKYLALISAMAISLTACGNTSKSDDAIGYSAEANNPGSSVDQKLAASNPVNNKTSNDMADYEEPAMAEEANVSASDNAASDSAASGNSAEAPASETNPNGNKNVAQQSQKLIKSYYYKYQSTAFDDAISKIHEKVTSCNGYIESSDCSGTGHRYANFTIRIPVDMVADFLSDTSSFGEEISSSESAKDVTLDYNDSETHVKTLKTKHERLLELLKTATKLEDIITLEQEISDVEFEINQYESQLKLYDNLIDYVTIDLEISEVTQIVPTENDSFWQKLSKGFMGSLSDLGDLFKDLAYGIIVALPFLIIPIIIIVLIIIKIKKTIKKNKNRQVPPAQVPPTQIPPTMQ